MQAGVSAHEIVSTCKFMVYLFEFIDIFNLPYPGETFKGDGHGRQIFAARERRIAASRVASGMV